MPIDASIPLQGINPVQTLGDLTKVDNLRSEIMARQKQSQVADQEMEARGLAIDQQKRDAADQQQLQQYMADPANQASIRKGDLTGIYGKVQPKTAIGLQQHFIEAQKNAAALDETTLKLNTERHTALQNGLQGLLALPEADRAQAYAGMVQSMNQSGVAKGLNLPQTLPDFSDASLNKLGGVNAVYHGIFEGAQKDKKAAADLLKVQTDADKAAADAANTRAGIPKTEADATIRATQAAGMNAAGLLPEEQQKADDAAATLAETKRRNDQLAKHETAEEANHRQSAGIAAAHLKIAQQTYDQTYGAGSDQALVGVDPKARNAARAAMNKATNEYQTAVKSADDLQSVIDLTKGGNKAAGAALPLVGVEALNAVNGIKRINKSEIDQYAGAGSLLDSIQGKIGKVVSGQPIPPDVLKDIESLHSILKTNADRAHEDRVQGINHTFNSNFTPLKIDHPGMSGGGSSKIRVQIPGHPPGTIDASQKADFLKSHPDAKVL